MLTSSVRAARSAGSGAKPAGPGAAAAPIRAGSGGQRRPAAG